MGLWLCPQLLKQNLNEMWEMSSVPHLAQTPQRTVSPQGGMIILREPVSIHVMPRPVITGSRWNSLLQTSSATRAEEFELFFLNEKKSQHDLQKRGQGQRRV